MTIPPEPGHYWVILEEGCPPEIAYFDGDDWAAIGREEMVWPVRVVSGPLEPPGGTSA